MYGISAFIFLVSESLALCHSEKESRSRAKFFLREMYRKIFRENLPSQWYVTMLRKIALLPLVVLTIVRAYHGAPIFYVGT